MPAKVNPEFAAANKKLRKILSKFETGALAAIVNQADNYCLIGPPTDRSQGRDVWFGAVQVRKSYVSYHLMPVYAFPELLTGMSPALKKRMQGKSCFNFKTVDEDLFSEIAELTKKGYQRFKEEKLILK